MSIESVLEEIRASCAQMVDRLSAGGGGVGGADNNTLGPLESTGIALAALQQVVSSVQVALYAMETPLTALAGAMAPFVAALSPATVQAFDWALKGLHATIGTALLPAFQVLTGIVRDMAGTIDPLMKQLAPVLQHVAEILGGVFMTVIQTVVNLFTGLMPVVEFLVSVLELLGTVFSMVQNGLQLTLIPVMLMFQVLGAVLKPVMEVLNWLASMLSDVFKGVEVVIHAVVATVMQFIGSLLGGLTLKDTLQRLTEIVQKVIIQFVLFTAYLAAMLGQQGYIDNLLKATAAVGQGEAAAPQNAGIKSLEDITKSIDTAAFTAGQGGKVDPQVDLLAKIHAALLKMDKGADMERTIYNAVEKVWSDVEIKAGGWLAQGIAQVIAKLPRAPWEGR